MRKARQTRDDSNTNIVGVAPPHTGVNIQLQWPPPTFKMATPEAEHFIDQDPNLAVAMRELSESPIPNLNHIVYLDDDEGFETRTPQTDDDGVRAPLGFESRFESGNLQRAMQIREYEYDLLLKPDINTNGHTQWFYFAIKNPQRGKSYKFNIINMAKPDSLYNMGMQPLVYSVNKAKRQGTGWVRRGRDICYFQNNRRRKHTYYYTLTFTLDFEDADCTENDIVYCAHCYPYTYTDLQVYLGKLEEDETRRNRFRRRPLCQTLAGNICDLLTITSFACDPEALKGRKGIVLTARVHPGETNASWMMKGIIDYLTGPSLDAKVLRDNFIFKVIPMLNPDGVVVGNYRCSLAGVDLNRNYLNPSPKLHPTIFYMKQMLRRFQEDRQVVLYSDFHGHSRKMDIFMYGCCPKKSGRYMEKVFPLLLSKDAEMFSFAESSFKVQRSKESTGRVVVHKEFKIANSYTVEASFAGTTNGERRNCHFSPQEYEALGHHFCDTILEYFDPDQSKVFACIEELRGNVGGEDSDDEESLGSDAEDAPDLRALNAEDGKNVKIAFDVSQVGMRKNDSVKMVGRSSSIPTSAGAAPSPNAPSQGRKRQKGSDDRHLAGRGRGDLPATRALAQLIAKRAPLLERMARAVFCLLVHPPHRRCDRALCLMATSALCTLQPIGLELSSLKGQKRLCERAAATKSRRRSAQRHARARCLPSKKCIHLFIHSAL